MAPRLTPEEREKRRLANRSRAQRWAEGLEAMKRVLENAKEEAEEMLAIREEMEAEAEKPDYDDTEDPDVDELDAKLGTVQGTLETFSTDDIDVLKEEYEEWRGNLPEQLQGNSPVSEKLDEVCDSDTDFDLPTLEDHEKSTIESFISELDEQIDKITELENIDLPRGFGRD